MWYMIKKIKENMSDIVSLNEWNPLKYSSDILTVQRKFWEKIKASLEDISNYKQDVKKLREYKKYKSQQLIEKYNYNEKTKFYKRIRPAFIVKQWDKYFISSHDEISSVISSHVDNKQKYTNHESISTTDEVFSEYCGYGPLLVSFSLKDALGEGWILTNSQRNNRVFQFEKRTLIPVVIENNTERTIDIYNQYQSLFKNYLSEECSTEVSPFHFSIFKNNKVEYSFHYKVDWNKNKIIIESESNNIQDEYMKLWILRVIISRWLELDKNNILIERNGVVSKFEELY